MSHLLLQQVSKRYGAHVAVEALDLAVARGECIALLGPSGCGKTTTLRMVAGFIVPDAGQISLDGRSIERVPPHQRGIGMVFQNYALFPHLTAAGNVAFGLEMQGLGRREIGDRVAQALAMVGLAQFGERYPAQLSGGQQQRVALARALVTRPALLLLDEPLSNLDAGLRVEMRQEIAALRSRLGITTLFVTHDQEEAMALADRIAVMERGRLVECATPEALTEHPEHVFTARFLGDRAVLPGRVEAGRFRAAGGIALAAAGAPTHLVLRAARLRLAPVGTAEALAEGRVASATWLGDAIAYEIALHDGPTLPVLRPTTEPACAPGMPVAVLAPAEAIAWITDPTALAGEPA